MSVATSLYQAVRSVPDMHGIDLYTDWAEVDERGPYAVLEAEAIGSGDPPELILLASADVWVYHSNAAKAQQLSQAVRNKLDGYRFEDPENEVTLVRPVLTTSETGQVGALSYARTAYDVRACKVLQ